MKPFYSLGRALSSPKKSQATVKLNGVISEKPRF